MTLALFNVLRARVEVSSLSYRPQEEPDAKERLKMIRLSSLIVCASILACAMSQTPTTSSTVMSSTTTAPQPTPTTGPTTMPPTTPPPPQNDYLVKGDGGKVCLRMVANIKVKFDYLNATSNKTVSYNYTLDEAGAVVDEEQSRCSANESQLVLEFDPPKDEGNPNYMFFPFIKTTDKAAWKALPVVYNFTVTKEQFDGSDFIGTPVSYTATKDLLSENVDVKGSYRCKSVEDATLNSSSTNYTLNVTVMIVNLQAQPFFDDAKEGGKFGTVSECPADSGKGNKIVPIAVGAALAGLVIVVLIAYLIGRLKSRRQSSYEALS